MLSFIPNSFLGDLIIAAMICGASRLLIEIYYLRFWRRRARRIAAE